MRDITGLAVGIIVGATIAWIGAYATDSAERRSMANMVTIDQCIRAIIKATPENKI